jgi:hypothetical protein
MENPFNTYYYISENGILMEGAEHRDFVMPVTGVYSLGTYGLFFSKKIFKC